MNSKNKKRFSSEYTMFSILEYLYIYAQKISVTKYNIVTNIHGIKQQRADRIHFIMDILEQHEYVRSVKTSNAIFYQITEKGIEAYSKWIKDFLNFARHVNKTEDEHIT